MTEERALLARIVMKAANCGFRQYGGEGHGRADLCPSHQVCKCRDAADAILASDWFREQIANAERRGMERAEKIAREWSGKSQKLTRPWAIAGLGAHAVADAIEDAIGADLRAYRLSLREIEAKEREEQRQSWARQDKD